MRRDPSTSMTMQRLRRQRPFLESILKESNRFKRQALLQHANKDQINAVSEMVLNLLKDRIPVKPQTLRTLQRHKKVLCEVGNAKIRWSIGAKSTRPCTKNTWL